ncbi:hypothetical protein Tco_1421032 [Tanacetum coccineum]
MTIFMRQETPVCGRRLPVSNAHLQMVVVLICELPVFSQASEKSSWVDGSSHIQTLITQSMTVGEAHVDVKGMEECAVFMQTTSDVPGDASEDSTRADASSSNHLKRTHDQTHPTLSAVQEAVFLESANINAVENTQSIHNEVIGSAFPSTADSRQAEHKELLRQLGADSQIELHVAVGNIEVPLTMEVNVFVIPRADYVAWLLKSVTSEEEESSNNTWLVFSAPLNKIGLTASKEQSDIRSDYLLELYDTISRGERERHEVGGRIPMSFTGGPRYIYMAQFLELTTFDRADVVCRVFEQKIKLFIAILKKE